MSISYVIALLAVVSIFIEIWLVVMGILPADRTATVAFAAFVMLLLFAAVPESNKE